MTVTAITLPISLYILHEERKKRQSGEAIFASKALGAFSYLCIATGPIVLILSAFEFIESSICYIFVSAAVAAHSFQGLFMEYFQVSRLHYCFSADQVHSDKGYPKWIFMLMFAAITLIEGAWIVLVVLIINNLFCRISTTSLTGFLMSGNPRIYIAFTIAVVFVNFQLITALLYWIKLRHIMKHNESEAVHRNLEAVLFRILILTLSYTFVNAGIQMVALAFGPVMTVVYSASMYLMQDHNTKEYVTFLGVLKKSKMYLCCCCCHRIFERQYEILTAQLADDAKRHVVADQPVGLSGAESRNMSVVTDYGINKTGMEMSIETKTVQRDDDVS